MKTYLMWLALIGILAGVFVSIEPEQLSPSEDFTLEILRVTETFESDNTGIVSVGSGSIEIVDPKEDWIEIIDYVEEIGCKSFWLDTGEDIPCKVTVTHGHIETIYLDGTEYSTGESISSSGP